MLEIHRSHGDTKNHVQFIVRQFVHNTLPWAGFEPFGLNSDLWEIKADVLPIDPPLRGRIRASTYKSWNRTEKYSN